jgi:hypothetical protein
MASYTPPSFYYLAPPFDTGFVTTLLIDDLYSTIFKSSFAASSGFYFLISSIVNLHSVTNSISFMINSFIGCPLNKNSLLNSRYDSKKLLT